MKNTKSAHCFTVDLEDWYHIYPPERWDAMESRLEEPTLWLLDQLAERGITATFFVLGYIAQRHPDLIRHIAAKGHEIGSHGYDHMPVFKKTPEGFADDIALSLDIIENIINIRPDLYRAPSFSITEKYSWVWPILAEKGIRRDSSLFAAPRRDGGCKDVPNRAFSIKLNNGNTIQEYPILPEEIGPLRIPFSGGGYFRILPKMLLKHWIMSANAPVIFYIHPRDIDPSLPDIPILDKTRKWMVYHGLRSARNKLISLLDSVTFGSIGTVYGAE